mmetsp:Transcript_47035/g.69952  ORF Transcript_47035/g.69952 Transcript_47035/m.69952 type:complete len:83 (+) Transcript_47035:3-251(+)
MGATLRRDKCLLYEIVDTPKAPLEAKLLPSIRSHLKHIHRYFGPLQRLYDSSIVGQILDSRTQSRCSTVTINMTMNVFTTSI